ncbi:MAG: hypothetical protein K2X66_08005 [Cyanobacteria bacterium]|nr:hypothetical protein [Cyanobacteriota bacterium]
MNGLETAIASSYVGGYHQYPHKTGGDSKNLKSKSKLNTYEHRNLEEGSGKSGNQNEKDSNESYIPLPREILEGESTVSVQA